MPVPRSGWTADAVDRCLSHFTVADAAKEYALRLGEGVVERMRSLVPEFDALPDYFHTAMKEIYDERDSIKSPADSSDCELEAYAAVDAFEAVQALGDSATVRYWITMGPQGPPEDPGPPMRLQDRYSDKIQYALWAQLAQGYAEYRESEITPE